MTSRRVAFVSTDPGVPIFGTKGCSIHAQEILRGFLRAGCDVTALTTRTGGNPAPDLTPVQLIHLPAIQGTDLAQREDALLRNNDHVHHALEEAGPFDLVYERHALFAHAAMAFAEATRTPGVLEVNAPLIEEQALHRGLIRRAAAEQSARRAFDAATVLLGVSDEVGNYLRRLAASPGRVHVIPNGVDPDRFPASPLPTTPGRPFTVGFVGTLKPWHGLASLVDAFARLRTRAPDSRLVLVGDGPERPDIEARLAAADALSSATFTGAVPPDAIPAHLAAMDVAVAPYPMLADFYFSPLKVYEYMAARRPVVVSRIGQLRSLIAHEVNGLLFEPGDAEDLAHQLLRLHRDPQLRLRLGHNARETIVGAHTWTHVVRRILQAAGLSGHGTFELPAAA